MRGNDDAGGNRLQIQRLPYKGAQGSHQRAGFYRAARHHFLRGMGRQSDLLFGAQQNNVGQRGFHCITNAAAALCCTFADAGCTALRFALVQMAPVLGAHTQRACERAAQRLVGRNQGLEPFIDLPVFTLAPFLHRLHEDQTNAHHQTGNQQQTQHRREQG